MPYLIALIGLLGFLCVLNLFFTMGVIRRLREHTRLLNEKVAAKAPSPSMSHSPRRFTATTVDGTPLSSDSFSAPTLIGFFTPGCEPCEEALPKFLSYAVTHTGGREHVLAVLREGEGDAGEYAARLADVAHVVVEAPGGPVQSAFSVAGYPAFGLLGADGIVTVSTWTVDDLPAAVPA